MRKSIALLLGLSLATLTACGISRLRKVKNNTAHTAAQTAKPSWA